MHSCSITYFSTPIKFLSVFIYNYSIHCKPRTGRASIIGPDDSSFTVAIIISRRLPALGRELPWQLVRHPCNMLIFTNLGPRYLNTSLRHQNTITPPAMMVIPSCTCRRLCTTFLQGPAANLALNSGNGTVVSFSYVKVHATRASLRELSSMLVADSCKPRPTCGDQWAGVKVFFPWAR